MIQEIQYLISFFVRQNPKDKGKLGIKHHTKQLFLKERYESL